jgi:hypothetical protein
MDIAGLLVALQLSEPEGRTVTNTHGSASMLGIRRSESLTIQVYRGKAVKVYRVYMNSNLLVINI